MVNVWSSQHLSAEGDLAGYDVDATDGHIGTIDEANATTDAGHIIVDTGHWIFGKRRLLPAGVITKVDTENRRVSVSLTKDQIKDAPDIDENSATDDDTVTGGPWRDAYDHYYGPYVDEYETDDDTLI